MEIIRERRRIDLMLTFHCDKNTLDLLDELKCLSEYSEALQPVLILYSGDNAEMITSEVSQRCAVMRNNRLQPHTIIIVERSDL